MKDKELRETFDYFKKVECKNIAHTEALKVINDFVNRLKECEECGCLLLDNAVKGKSIIKTEIKYYGFSQREVDYIHTPYYCKIHAPKGDEE